MDNKLKLITLTGPSCSGKTTLLNELVANHGYQNVVSHTTRPPRSGEVNGRDYHFVDNQAFVEDAHEGEFLENVIFNGYRYGVSQQEVYKANQAGKTAVVIVEPKGLIQILKHAEKYDKFDVKSVFISGDLLTLVARYLKRMNGEDLSAEGVAERHAKRIYSLNSEVLTWTPDTFESGTHPWDYLIKRPSLIPYNLVINDCNDENFNSVITQIKGLHNDQSGNSN